MHQVPARVRRRGLNHIKEAAAAASFLSKSFDQTFSKVCAGRGRAALVASAEAKLPLRHFFGSFFVPTCSKKERRGFAQRNPKRMRAITDRPYLLRKNLYFPLNLCYNILKFIKKIHFLLKFFSKSKDMSNISKSVICSLKCQKINILSKLINSSNVATLS